MRKDFGSKTWIYPMPVLMVATYNEDGSPNCMTAAWGGIADTNKIAVCLDSSHKTTKNILLNKEFSISIADIYHIKECDYLGLVSYNEDSSKFEKTKLKTIKSTFVNAPIIEDLPFCIECKLDKVYEDEGLFIAHIVNISIDERILNEKGQIDLNKFKPITYDPINHNYIALGEIAGKAFFDGLKLK